MADDKSRLFGLSDTLFLAHMPTTYPQPQITWQLYPLYHQLLSCVICTLCRKLYKQELHKMCECTGSGPNYAPLYRLALLSNIHPSLELISFRYTDTGSNLPTTPRNS